MKFVFIRERLEFQSSVSLFQFPFLSLNYGTSPPIPLGGASVYELKVKTDSSTSLHFRDVFKVFAFPASHF